MAVSACGRAAAPAFRPAGPAPSPAPAAAAGPGQAAFAFPPGISIEFQTPLPASPLRRAIMAGYQDYVRSFWHAMYTGGRDRRYRAYMTGNALGFARRSIAFYVSRDHTIRGTARYFDTTVTSIYFGAGADVTSCVDMSRFLDVNASTGRSDGDVFPRAYQHYLEDVAMGRRPDGTWFVSHTASYPASTPEGARCQ